jgi:hypothetical protein
VVLTRQLSYVLCYCHTSAFISSMPTLQQQDHDCLSECLMYDVMYDV